MRGYRQLDRQFCHHWLTGTAGILVNEAAVSAQNSKRLESFWSVTTSFSDFFLNLFCLRDYLRERQTQSVRDGLSNIQAGVAE